MKKLALGICLSSIHFLNAQITINQTHMPINGDTSIFSTAIIDTAILFNFQNSGANLTWDFDSLVPNRQGIKRYINSSQTPYSSSVPSRIGDKLADTLNIGGFEVYDAFDFIDSDTTKFAIDHRGITAPTGLTPPFPSTISVSPSYSDEDEIYQFPLDYLDRDSSTYKVVFSNPAFGVYYESSGERINEVDAWGTLITPYDTFNTIRVVTDIFSFDTISFGGNNVGIDSHQREYKWLSTELKIPAMTISGAVVNGVFIPATVQFRDTARNLPSILAPVALFTADDLNPDVGDTVNFLNLSISLLSINSEWKITPSTFSYVNSTSSIMDTIAVVFNDSGLYDVQLIVTNSEGSDTLLIEEYIDVQQGITTLKDIELSANKVSVFPNPIRNSEQLNIRMNNDILAHRIELYDAKGQLIKRFDNLNTNTPSLRLPKSIGMHYMKITTNQGLILKNILIQ